MANTSEHKPICWVVSDGRAGVENQALGLAEAVARLTPLQIQTKRIRIRGPWKYLPRSLWGDPFAKLSGAADDLTPPFPSLWIACGKISAPLTIAVKKMRPATMTVQIQHPRMNFSQFDLVIPPHHDKLTGDNVFAILGAPHRVTRERLKIEAQKPGVQFEEFNGPCIAVLIGGPNRAYKMDQAGVDDIIGKLSALSDSGAQLLVTTSRRTPPGVADKITQALGGFPNLIFDAARESDGQNPYSAMLAAADHILVTADSVNMATEAAATGKPVQIIPMSLTNNARKRASAKFEAFHKALIIHGAARYFNGVLESWDVSLLDETARAAAEIVSRWRRGKGAGSVGNSTGEVIR